MVRRTSAVLCAAIAATLGATCAASAQVTFGVIGDFGVDGGHNLNVSNLVKSWNPAFITTVGDNNYDVGGADTIDDNIGKYYSDFIGNYTGIYGPGSPTNRFFPSLGNHDWGNISNNPTGADPYLNYFTLPGNERYYDVAPDNGPVRLFIIDSDRNEPDSVSSHGVQGQWLKQRLAETTEPFKLVVFHHAAYSSSDNHGSHSYMQWPFKQWGATAVLQGHDHTYERLGVAGIPYFVNGIGGSPSLYGFGSPLPESQVRYNDAHGAMRISATASQMTFQAFNTSGALVDTFTQNAPAPETTVTRSFQEGAAAYAGTQDTFLEQANPAAVNGASSRATVDGSPVSHGLIRFDSIFGPGTSQIPFGSQIRYANLRLVTGSDGATNDQSPNLFSLHRMLVNWNESSTWNSMTNGIGLGTDAASASDFVVQPQFLGDAMNFDVTGTVQLWANSALGNLGWALFNTNGTDGWRFVTSESSVLANRPALEITYLLPTMSWNVDADGNWSTGANWLGGIAPNGAGVAASFTSAITGAHTVTVNSPHTVGRILFDNSTSYTIAGSNTLTISAAGASPGEIDVVSGSHTISAPLTLAGDLHIDVTPAASTLTISSDVSVAAGVDITKDGAGTLAMKNVRASGLTISAGTLSVLPDGTAAAVRKIDTLSIAAAAALDLNDNDLIVELGDFAQIQALVFQGFEATTGITSSTSNGSQILALFDNALVGSSDWNGIPIGANATVGKYTYFGDVNLDGQVTGDDYTVIDANLNTTPAVGLEWLSGDMNLDGAVTGDDYTVIDANLGLGAGNPLSPVPEPMGFTLLAIAALVAPNHRRRRALILDSPKPFTGNQS